MDQRNGRKKSIADLSNSARIHIVFLNSSWWFLGGEMWAIIIFWQILRVSEPGKPILEKVGFQIERIVVPFKNSYFFATFWIKIRVLWCGKSIRPWDAGSKQSCIYQIFQVRYCGKSQVKGMQSYKPSKSGDQTHDSRVACLKAWKNIFDGF